MFDVIIIGGGGGGLTAALYSARANFSVLLLEKVVHGGQIAVTDLVENYPGFPEGILGPEIAERMMAQAKRYGTQIVYEEAKQIVPKKDYFEVLSSQKTYQGKTIILTMGASFRMLGVEREKELTGKGVSYCATCDGAFFKEKEVVVVGGGDSAMQEGIFLTRFAKKVTVVHRRDELRASPILQKRAKENQKIHFLWDTVIEKIKGTNKVNGVLLKNVKTGKTEELSTDGVFIFIGHDPNTSSVKGFVELDKKGYVVTHESLETSVSGIFAAGEVRKGAVWQLVAACGEGCEAALAAQAYLKEHLS